MDRYDFLFLSLVILHLYIAPFTKVEESFNLQATHDILSHGVFTLEKYDHFEFPGVVPRTFLGPAVLATLAYPFKFLLQLFYGDEPMSKFWLQYIVRACLGGLNVIAMSRFRSSIEKSFGVEVSIASALFNMVQFHGIFWISRTLPNMFAYYFVLIAFHFWLKEDHSSRMKMIGWLTFGLVIFRFELVLLLGPIVLLELYRREIGFWETIQQGLLCGLTGLALSLVVDSYFWNQLGMYPEGYVFWFNAVLGKSSEWGVSPFHTYFTGFLPKLLLAAAPLALYGSIVDRRLLRYLIPMVSFIVSFSFLGHKEWRFIIYCVPIFNMAAGVGLVRLYRTASKSQVFKLFHRIAVFSLLLSFIISTSMLLISSQNYPGGVGLLRIHELEFPQDNGTI
ncbi:hypothetical protein K493DRAFT_88739 [Basidiobolus meristosporus CBS 931.73]|uniref:Mannosyltransferase n=1 Tax=Basidiobolus meristosporus CBS 931.73 TaxID=1314790 RepID=A0A1Y1YWJ7_9FUNG|nr:hypothetical protein K493DRAFT_88739 [Basidiobolus meristosporus CBS 931.73]|eukprot:ORY01945.1 hypothetical protein K493DRAFT_88739 [Basidiobolus meristosporus CBS 931.73]